MTLSLSPTPRSGLAKIADVIGSLDEGYHNYYSSPDSSTNSSSSDTDSDAPILTRRHRQMGSRRRNTPHTTEKRALSPSSYSTQNLVQEKKQKTVKQNEATTLGMKSINPFKTTAKFLVGPEDEEFQVHPFLLEAIGLSCLFSVGKSTGPVRLPDLDSKTFKEFVEWLYSAQLRPEEAVDTDVKYSNLIDLYCVGQKMGGGESWMELVVKKMIELFDQTGRQIPSELTSVVYEKFPRGSRMRRLWVTFNVLGEATDLSQTQRCVIREHKPDMDYLLEPFNGPQAVLGIKKKLAVSWRRPCSFENDTAAQPTKQDMEKQSQQVTQSQPESTPQSTGEWSAEPSSTPCTSGSSSGQKDPTTKASIAYVDLLKKFQSAGPKTSAP